MSWGLLGLLLLLPGAAPPGNPSAPSKIEPDRLRVDPTVRLNGEPFPKSQETETGFATPRRLRYASPQGRPEGDGSEARPWQDVQAGFRALEPGDRLVLLPGNYDAAYSIEASCRAGTAEAPIQVFGEEAFLRVRPNAYGVTVGRPFWQFHHMQLILEAPGSKGLLARGEDAHDILFDRGHVYEGDGVAIHAAAGSSRLTISNSHIHQTGGIRVEGGSREIRLTGNKIHHNRAAGLRVSDETTPSLEAGRGPTPLVNLAILGNKFHNDTGPAMDLSGCRGVRIEDNKIYNYRPGKGSKGEAIVLGGGVAEVVIARNYFAEASIGVRAGPGTGDRANRAQGPEDVLLARNFFENLLGEESAALVVEAGRDIRFYNNTIESYATGIRIGAAPPIVERISFANNLILNARALAFDLASLSAAAHFDHNAFGWQDSEPKAKVSTELLDLKGYLARGSMPNSKASAGVQMTGRDLGSVSGLSLKDAGKAFDGLTFSGSSPDIGVAEK